MKKILAVVLSVALIVCLAGCIDQRQADDVSYNLSLKADNFEDVRQITVINCLQGDVLFQMTGKMSIEADMADKQLEIVVEDENGQFKKHFIGLSDKVLQSLQSQSANAIDMVTTTINQLSSVNEQIDVTIGEIEDVKSKLQHTEDDLSKTKEHNAKIINKFKALIE